MLSENDENGLKKEVKDSLYQEDAPVEQPFGFTNLLSQNLIVEN
jgi:hypothetical protein